MRVIACSIFAFGAYLVAETGKARFAASDTEGIVGGQMWYLR
jgi:hypothetical protein